MTKTAIRIRENNNSNVEMLMRILMVILTIRGTSFIYHEVKDNGGELLIFLDEEFLIGDIYEATDFQDYSIETIYELLKLVKDKSHTSIVEVDYKIDIKEVVISKSNIEL